MTLAALPPSPDNCCAIVVSYHPDTGFLERLDRIGQQFKCVVIIDNASTLEVQNQLQAYCVSKSLTNISLIQNPHNLGIASALNQGIDYALKHDFEWLITFDQDSVIEADLLAELIRLYALASDKPVLLGCNYFHSALNRAAIAPRDANTLVERTTLISSGTLIRSDLFKQVGKFRADYFIDSVDHEFSLRVRQHGFTLWSSTRVLMRHSIGNHSTSNRLKPFRIPQHSALRKYYITRNALVTAAHYARQEPLWAFKQLARLTIEFIAIILYEPAKLQKIAAMGLGISHAITGRMGELTSPQWVTTST